MATEQHLFRSVEIVGLCDSANPLEAVFATYFCGRARREGDGEMAGQFHDACLVSQIISDLHAVTYFKPASAQDV